MFTILVMSKRTPIAAIAAATLALLAPAAAQAEPQVQLAPAAGAPGTIATLTGSGYAPGTIVGITVDGRRRATARAKPDGTFIRRVAIPRRATGKVAVASLSRAGTVANSFSISASTRAPLARQLAARDRVRLSWSPPEQAAGTTVRVRGTGFAARRSGLAYFPSGGRVRFRPSSRGSFSATITVPSDPPGEQPFLVRQAGRRLEPTFTILPDPVIGAAGDISCGSTSIDAQCKQEETAQLLEKLAPSVVLPLGDIQYEFGDLGEFMARYDPSWGRLKAITRPVPGNHEYGDSDPAGCGFACGYWDYFNGPGQRNGPAGERGKGWYAFDQGTWRLYALNTNCTRGQEPSCAVGSEQWNWLKADLEANPRSCTLMYMHHPMFTSDTRPFDTPAIRAALRPLWDLFYANRGDVVLAGHSHFYERYAPQDPAGRPDPQRGIRQIIVGTGGRSVYGFGAVEPNSEVRDGRTIGVLGMSLHRGAYSWRFIHEAGRTFTDWGASRCH